MTEKVVCRLTGESELFTDGKKYRAERCGNSEVYIVYDNYGEGHYFIKGQDRKIEIGRFEEQFTLASIE